MDLGSAVMTTEMVLESMEDRKIKMVDCPVTEGAIAAAVVAAGGASISFTLYNFHSPSFSFKIPGL